MATKKRLEGRVLSVLIADQDRSLVSTARDQVQVTWGGFAGDKHEGVTMRSGGRTPHYPRGTEIRNARQVTLVSEEELAEIAAALRVPEILPDWLGANLLVRGIPSLTQIPPSTRLFFPGGAVLVVDGENRPCTGPGAVIVSQYPDRQDLTPQEFPRAARGRRGLVAWVERPGVLRTGDTFWLKVPDLKGYRFPYPGSG